MLKQPEFPLDFVLTSCPKVCEARKWSDIYNQNLDEKELASYAECAMVRKAEGIFLCENCGVTVTSTKYTTAFQEYYFQIDSLVETEKNLGEGI